NKAERRRVRTLVMVHKDTSKLEEEAHGVNLQKEKEKTTKEHVPIYFHPTLNPSGLPPPGVSVDDEKEGSFEDDSGSEFSDYDSEAEAKQESDEDIPLPPGSPPTKESDDELPELPPDLPPGPPPRSNTNMSSYSPLMAIPSHPSPFGFNHQGSLFPPPPGTFVFNPLGSPSHQRPNMRTPPHPTFGPGPIPFSRGPPLTASMHPIQGQGYPVRPSDAPHPRPPPFSSQVSHYGPPPQIPGGNNNISSRSFSPSTISNNAQLAKASAATATPIIQAAPQVRNLQKELTTLIPTALLRKKAAANKPKVAIPVVNAAPNIDDGLVNELSTVTPTKRSASTTIHLLQEQKPSEVDSSQSNGGIISSSAPPPTKKAKKKKADEYEKFMAEMQDLL
ncbi:18656_t:CDS:2, partial [Funneliformis geosporum]